MSEAFSSATMKSKSLRLVFLLACLATITFSWALHANGTAQVIVDGRAYPLTKPPGMCDASGTKWGASYQSFLKGLGANAGGDPQILWVLSDCDFPYKSQENTAPKIWGYLAFDETLGKYWLGQRSLNKRLRSSLGNGVAAKTSAAEVRELTSGALKKMKSNISVGELVPLSEQLETKYGYLMSALTRLQVGQGSTDVYLLSVTFIRNREVLTLTLYTRANSAANFEEFSKIGKQFMNTLRDK